MVVTYYTYGDLGHHAKGIYKDWERAYGVYHPIVNSITDALHWNHYQPMSPHAPPGNYVHFMPIISFMASLYYAP